MDAGVKYKRKPNPRQHANPLSVVTFFYTLPLFFKGWKKDLEETDLYETWTVHKSNKLGDKLEAAWKTEEQNAKKFKRTPSLRRVIFKTFGFEFALCGLAVAFTDLCVKIVQPLVLGELIMYFSPEPDTTVTLADAYGYAAGLIGCSLVAVLVGHPYIVAVFHVGMKIRIACCSLIYRKALQLDKTALGQTTVGQVVNLLANDVSRFDIVAVYVHWIWLGPVQTVIITYFMYREIGVAAILGVVVMILFIPLQFFLGHLTSKLRLKTAIKTDERVRLMNEVISGIQVIKMYTWEKPFAKLVSLARKTEISTIRSASYIKGVVSSFILFITRLTLFISILSYVLFGNTITARQVFAVTAYYNTLRYSMTNFFPHAIAFMAEANVSINRLNNFMLYKSRDVEENGGHTKGNEKRTKGNEKHTKGNKKHSKANEQHTKVNEQHTKANEQQAKENEQHTKENEQTENSKKHTKANEQHTKANEQQAKENEQHTKENEQTKNSKKQSQATKEEINETDEQINGGTHEQTNGGIHKQTKERNEQDDETEEETNDKSEKRIAISVTDGTAKWSEASSENTFTNINLQIKHGNLVAVIGPVGSGKSSLFHAILKELHLTTGSLDINGSVSYASQEPWLFSGSIRQNILFGAELDRHKYKKVIRKCALERDFSLFPYGDKTIVGERGISLSGGQRARINLARAVYKDADIYLLDDPLSAVDTHVGKQLFEECIQDYLFGKTVILITHQLQYLKAVDHIVILDDGFIKAEGSYGELQDSGLDFAKLLKTETEEEEKQERKLSKRKMSLQNQASVMSSASFSDETPTPVQVEEQKSKGAVSGYVYMSYVKAGANCCLIFTFVLLLVLAQIFVSVADYFVSYWVNLEQERGENTTSRHPYSYVQRSATATEHSMLKNEFLRSGDDFWDFSRETCIYIYTFLTIGIVALALTRSIAFYVLCMRASKKLHDIMFDSIIRATMRFFNTNTSGRILNRFSKDIGAVDERLPQTMLDVLQIGLMLIGIVTIVATVDVWLLVPSVVILIIFYLVRVFYLRTSRDVKRLEGVTRSPVFAHLNASLQGLTTIRAFGAQQILEREFDKHQDLHSSAFYSFMASSSAFGYALDLICVVYITLVTLSFLVLGDEQYGGNVGLAITQTLGLTGMFQWGMRQTTELENLMTSVERMLEYAEVEHEPPLESAPNKKPPSYWPKKGEIKFENLYLYYFTEDPPVLRNLNFTINPLEKVGIVGRTGAGKSSLISALFLLTDTKGSIIIDDVPTKDIGLHDLRSKISIIPQEPVLFSGTMRKNLDPFDEYDDEVLWKALEEVELKEAIADLHKGLNSIMSEGGSNFSVGQRQLVCLARAIIRNNRILVLDEATANVDPQTDALIQQTIRRKFADCTVLTIAHRLHTIMDSDKVLVMDAGTMVELDHPHVLLQNQDGHFYSMVQQTGKIMADVLTKIAKNKYEKLQQSEPQQIT